MDIETLFLHTCDDLEMRISSNDDYILLGASKLIRQLFLDGDKSLVDLVNRKTRIKLKFEVIDVEKFLEIFQTPEMPPFEFVGVQDGLDPDTIPNPPRKIVNRDDFFQLPLQISGGKSFTVREIVLHQANSMGGVHAGAYAGEPKDDTEKLLLSTDTTTKIFNLPPGLRQLKSIGQVVLKTLAPLRMILFCSKALESNPDDVAAYSNRVVAG